MEGNEEKNGSISIDEKYFETIAWNNPCLDDLKIISCTNHTKATGKAIFVTTQENKTIRQNISCVFGSKQLTNLLEITDTHLDEEIAEEYGIKNTNSRVFELYGFISSCEHGSGRCTTDRQFYYINSRPCEPTKVMKLTNEIYHRYNLHQYPFILLNITVPKESVDVNVTPDKRLIFLENEKLLLACVKSTLIKLFENIPSTYRLNMPVSVVSGGQCSRSSDDRVSDTKKSSFDLSKWRHATDKTSQQTTIITAQKRHLSLSRFDNSSSKQMKLDQVMKFTKKVDEAELDPTVDENESAVSRKSERSRTEEENEPECVENTENDLVDDEEEENENFSTVDSRNENILIEEPVLERASKNTVQIESTEIKETIIHADKIFEGSDGEIRNDETSESITENDENTETIVCDEEESIADCHEEGKNVNLELCTVEESEKASCIKNSAVIDTSVETLRKIFRDGRERRRRSTNFTNKFHAEIDPTKNSAAEDELKKEISKSTFREMKIIGQFNLGFIIAKLGSDLFIVDQHATDEKYNFETLQRTTTLKSQKLIAPQDLNLTTTNEFILMSSIEIFRKNGFEFSIDPDAQATQKVKLLSIPVSQNWQFGKDDIDEMLFMLQDAPNTLCRPSRIRAMFASRACRKSVMIGMPLTINDMRRLVNNMGTIEQPWNCPHGRPTMRHLVNLSLLN